MNESPEIGLPTRAAAAYVLFFDGDSRDNQGLAGDGAVLVKVNIEQHQAEHVQHACMLYTAPRMANNRAEKLGLVYGLQQAVILKTTTQHECG